jgi:dolichol-phosphate mannosyltransferase
MPDGRAGTQPVLSVMIMAYNEVASLERVAREIDGVLERAAPDSEIVIVDDGSSDGTETIADRLAASMPRVRVIHHRPNEGLGGVYRTGFREARGRYVTFFPADGQFPATIIEDFLPRMTDHDMVLGYLPDRRGSLVGKVLSLGERMLYTVLFGPMPRFQGILMFRTEILKRVELKSAGRGWAVLMELILRASRARDRLTSVPTTLRPRMSGTSKVNNFRTIWSNTRQMVELRRYF